MRAGSLCSIPLLACLLLFTACAAPRPRFEPESIHRLNRSPALHAGRGVILHGVVMEPAVNDGGSSEGLDEYRLCDDTGESVRVLTRRRPRSGIAVRVSGFVEQDPENALLPVVIEGQRSRPPLDLLLIAGLLILVIGSVPPAVMRSRRLRQMPVSPRGFADAPGSDPPVRPGVAYALDLVVVAGPDMGTRHSFKLDRIMVGRPGLRPNDLSLDDQTVSRRQAVILRDDKIGGYKIRNEGRTNPLKVNGRPCDAVALRDGDLLTVGLTTLQVGYRELPRSGSGGGSLLVLLLAGLLLGGGGPAVHAGQDHGVHLEQLELKELPRVTCRFRVDDAGGLGCLGLGPEDFRLLVDGRPPEEVALWSSVAEKAARHPRLALVVEVSGEDRGRGLFLLKSAISDFLLQMPESTAIALLTHGAGTQRQQELTIDRRQLLQQLDSIPLEGGVGEGSFYTALERAAGIISAGEKGEGAVVYFCRPGIFTRADMSSGTPKGVRDHPRVPVYPVLLPERDGRRTGAYLRQLALKLTAGFTGHYTLEYSSPGGEDNRVHSLRIDRMSSESGQGAGCRYLAVSGPGLDSGALLAELDRRLLLERLIGCLLGLLAGGLVFRWCAGGAAWLRIHLLLTGALTGFLISELIGRIL